MILGACWNGIDYLAGTGCVYRNVTQNRAFKCCECFTFHINDTVQLANPHPVYTYLIRIHTLALVTTVLWLKRVTYY